MAQASAEAINQALAEVEAIPIVVAVAETSWNCRSIRFIDEQWNESSINQFDDQNTESIEEEEEEKEEEEEDIKCTIDLADLRCPISLHLFCDPVIVGKHVYERDEIIKWLKKNRFCPLTKVPIDNTIIECHLIKKIVDSIIFVHPELKHDRYVRTDMEMLVSVIESKQWIKLLDFANIDTNYIFSMKLNYSPMRLLFELCNNDIVKHFIDNIIDLEVSHPLNGWKIIHYVCRFANSNITKYIIDKNVDLESKDNEGWTPIHYACHFSRLDVISYLIKKHVNVNERIKIMDGTERNDSLFDLIELNKKLSIDDCATVTQLIKTEMHFKTDIISLEEQLRLNNEIVKQKRKIYDEMQLKLSEALAITNGWYKDDTERNIRRLHMFMDSQDKFTTLITEPENAKSHRSKTFELYENAKSYVSKTVALFEECKNELVNLENESQIITNKINAIERPIDKNL